MNLSCDQATAICDKNQYGEASFWEIIKLNFHLILCKRCGLYSKQNNLMTKCYHKHNEKQKNNECCLEEKEKKQMKKEVLEKI